ncbi:hypothetical protein SKAU_G00384190 [Synaphobranchus kaupii]|uniref:Uncharacterized protein n=1 Tax=Synaphobranchus kaupii TaxID=118154 RepID=A0A9Q1IEZ5_SYNKA|nr:hypothetical protein SKAU_G00384190 [Synaphobranchus kaupii]
MAAAIKAGRIGNHKLSEVCCDLITCFLKGAHRLQAHVRRPAVPTWDLDKVLEALQQAPFKPLESAGLKKEQWATKPQSWLRLALISVRTFVCTAGDIRRGQTEGQRVRLYCTERRIVRRRKDTGVPRALSHDGAEQKKLLVSWCDLGGGNKRQEQLAALNEPFGPERRLTINRAVCMPLHLALGCLLLQEAAHDRGKGTKKARGSSHARLHIYVHSDVISVRPHYNQQTDLLRNIHAVSPRCFTARDFLCVTRTAPRLYSNIPWCLHELSQRVKGQSSSERRENSESQA